jgi:outer membrane protein
MNKKNRNCISDLALWSSLMLVFLCLPSLSIATNPGDQTLQALITEALEHNHGLQALNHQLDAAEASLQEARAAYYPQLGASAQYMITDNAPQAFMLQLNQRRLDMRDPAFDPNQPDHTDNLQMSLGVQYSIYQAARHPRQQATRVRNALARENLAIARNALVHAVTQGYYQVLEAQAFAAVQLAAQESLAESLRIARDRFQAGATVQTDVLNLEVKKAQAEEGLIRARNGVQLAIAALNTTIGKDIVTTEGLIEPVIALEAPAVQVEDIRSRPEGTAAMLQYELAGEHIRLARAGHRPSLYAFGSIIWDGERLNDREQSYLAGVALDWKWFDGGLTRARTRAAQAIQESAAAGMAQTRSQLQLEWKQANLQLQEAWQRTLVTERAITSAEESLRITRALYQEGAADIATLLVAEVALTETRMRAAAARYDYLIANSNLKRAKGSFAQTTWK